MAFDQKGLFDIVEVLLWQRGETFRDLSNSISIPYQTLQNYRHERSKLTAEALVLIARHLDCEIDHLANFGGVMDAEALSRALTQSMPRGIVPQGDLLRELSDKVVENYFVSRQELRARPNARLVYEKTTIHEATRKRRQNVVNNRLREDVDESDDGITH